MCERCVGGYNHGQNHSYPSHAVVGCVGCNWAQWYCSSLGSAYVPCAYKQFTWCQIRSVRVFRSMDIRMEGLGLIITHCMTFSAGNETNSTAGVVLNILLASRHQQLLPFVLLLLSLLPLLLFTLSRQGTLLVSTKNLASLKSNIVQMGNVSLLVLNNTDNLYIKV